MDSVHTKFANTGNLSYLSARKQTTAPAGRKLWRVLPLSRPGAFQPHNRPSVFAGVLPFIGARRHLAHRLETVVRLDLQYLDGALAGEPQAAERHEWMTLELLDQLVREQGGGEVAKFWRQSPMPAEGFVVQRVGQELTCFLEADRAGAGGQVPGKPEDPPDPFEASVARFRALGEVHKWMYDRVSLRRLLENLGFVEIEVCNASASSIPGFGTYCLDTNPDGSVRKPDSLFIEARKPPAKNTPAAAAVAA